MVARVHGRRAAYRLRVMLVGLVVLAGCGGTEPGGEETLSTVSPTTAEQTTVFDVPEGWQLGAGGLVVAQNPSDIDGVVPTGPRVVLVDSDETNLLEITEGTEPVEIVEGPVLDLGVGNHPAMSITVKETIDSSELVRRFVLVEVDGAPRLFVLEAPAGQWEAAADQLGEIIGITPGAYAAALNADRDGDGRSDPDEMAIGQDPDVFTSQACFELIDAQPTPAIALTLSGIDLSGVDLSGCSLTGANLTGANLATADLTAANLTMADLTDVDLTGGDLTRTALVAANLTGANLTDAVVIDASFVGADLTNTTPPSSWQSTICPDVSPQLRPQRHLPTLETRAVPNLSPATRSWYTSAVERHIVTVIGGSPSVK